MLIFCLTTVCPRSLDPFYIVILGHTVSAFSLHAIEFCPFPPFVDLVNALLINKKSINYYFY